MIHKPSETSYLRTVEYKSIGMSNSISKQYDKKLLIKEDYSMMSTVSTMHQSEERKNGNNDETFKSKLLDLKAEIFSLV